MNVDYNIKNASWFDFVAAADQVEPSKTGESEVDVLFQKIKSAVITSDNKTLSQGTAINVDNRSYKVGKDAEGHVFIYQVRGTPFMLKSERIKQSDLRSLTTLESVKSNHQNEIVVIGPEKKFDKIRLEVPEPPKEPKKKTFVQKLLRKK